MIREQAVAQFLSKLQNDPGLALQFQQNPTAVLGRTQYLSREEKLSLLSQTNGATRVDAQAVALRTGSRPMKVRAYARVTPEDIQRFASEHRAGPAVADIPSGSPPPPPPPGPLDLEPSPLQSKAVLFPPLAKGISPLDPQIAANKDYFILTGVGDKKGSTDDRVMAAFAICPKTTPGYKFDKTWASNTAAATRITFNYLFRAFRPLFGRPYYWSSDPRCIYDSYRDCFVLLCSGGNRIEDGSGRPEDWYHPVMGVAVSYPVSGRASARAAGGLGWHCYMWDTVSDYGEKKGPEKNSLWDAGDAGDFPCIGVGPLGLVQTNQVIRRKDADGNNGGAKYTRAVIADMSAMAAGNPDPCIHEIPALPDPTNGKFVGNAMPAVHHETSPGDGNPTQYLVGYRTSTTTVIVWRISRWGPGVGKWGPGVTSYAVEDTVIELETSGEPFDIDTAGASKAFNFHGMGRDVLKSVFQWPYLYFVGKTATQWQPSEMTNAAYVVRVSMAGFPIIPPLGSDAFRVELIEKHGVGDGPSWHMHCGWPSVDVTKAGDAVIVFARAGNTPSAPSPFFPPIAVGIYPEARYAVFYHNETFCRASQVLQVGRGKYTGESRWGDVAGACVDAVDGSSVWITHQYSEANGAAWLAVGRVKP